MKNDLLEQLIELREQLTRLKTVKCRMAHERVLVDPQTHLPILGVLPEMEFVRRGLCNPSKRYNNPACSHSTARYPIENALGILERYGLCGQLSDDLKNLSNAIYLLDHKKGEAEKQLARIVKQIRETESKAGKNSFLDKELFSINEKILEMERQHTIYASAVEKLKNNVLTALNTVIEIEEKFIAGIESR